MKKKEGLSESLEDYLEVILGLEQKNKVARVKDIAEKLNIQRGSVTGALKNLDEKGLINYEPYSFITLTDQGKKIAKKITRRHSILEDFLLRVIQLDQKKAQATACRMEHAVDEQFINKFVRFIEFIDQCPRTGDDWINAFVTYCASQKHEWQKCSQCIDSCKDRHQAKLS